jgi:hypothetical protein
MRLAIDDSIHLQERAQGTDFVTLPHEPGLTGVTHHITLHA